MSLLLIGHGWWAGRKRRGGLASGFCLWASQADTFSQLPFQWHSFSSLLELAEGTQSHQPSTGLDCSVPTEGSNLHLVGLCPQSLKRPDTAKRPQGSDV